MTLQDQIRQRWGQYGDWEAAGQDQVDALAQLFQQNGINDLSGFSLTGRDYVTPDTYSLSTGDGGDGTYSVLTPGGEHRRVFDAFNNGAQLGYLGDINSDGSYQAHDRNVDGVGRLLGDQNLIGWSSAGHGNTSFRVVDGPNGQPIVVPVWGSSSQQTYDDMRGIASILALAAGGYYSGAGGTTGAVANGALQGYGTAVAGNMIANPDGDVNSLVDSSLAGAATGALSGGIKAYGADQGWTPATTRAVQGGVNAAIRGGDGGDILKGAALSGAQGLLGNSTEATKGQGADLGGMKAMDFNIDPNYDYSGGGTNFNLGGWNVDGTDNGQFDFSKYTLSDLNSPYEFNAGTDWKGLGSLALKMLGKDKNPMDALLPMLLGAGLGAAGGKDQTITSSRAPWEPLQPYYKALAADGADLYGKYKAQPFSQAQQAAYGNVGNIIDLVNSNAGGLLSGFQANADGRNQFVRGQQRGLLGSSFNPTPDQWKPALLGSFGTRG